MMGESTQQYSAAGGRETQKKHGYNTQLAIEWNPPQEEKERKEGSEKERDRERECMSTRTFGLISVLGRKVAYIITKI